MTTTRKKRKKKSIFRSTFYRVYFALVILALIAIVGGTVWLNGALKDYESSQPKYAAQPVGQLFESRDFDRLYALDTSAAEISGGDREFYIESMRALTEGKRVEWTETFTGNADERRYNVKLDGEKFATFTLVPSGQTTPKGNRLWVLGSVTTNVKLREPDPTPEPTPEPTPVPQTHLCSITAPRGCTVSVNGVVLTAENANVTESPLYQEGFLPPDIPGPVMVAYEYETVDQFVEVAITDENGAPVEAVHDEDVAYTWTCPMRENEAVKAQYTEAVFGMAEKVAKFTSRDIKQSMMEKACAEGSPAEQIFENTSNQYFTPHSSVSFRNGVISDFYVLSDDCFTCHVSFDFVMKTEKGEMVYPTNYTFCIVRENDWGKLYNFLIY